VPVEGAHDFALVCAKIRVSPAHLDNLYLWAPASDSSTLGHSFLAPERSTSVVIIILQHCLEELPGGCLALELIQSFGLGRNCGSNNDSSVSIDLFLVDLNFQLPLEKTLAMENDMQALHVSVCFGGSPRLTKTQDH
jgi:hypothetical protein